MATVFVENKTTGDLYLVEPCGVVESPPGTVIGTMDAVIHTLGDVLLGNTCDIPATVVVASGDLVRAQLRVKLAHRLASGDYPFQTQFEFSAPPVASGDSYNLNEGEFVLVSAPGVLDNDFDPEGRELNAVLVTDSVHGALTLNADGSFVYVHDGSETTGDSFAYKASDGKLDSIEAMVAITVTPVNDSPIASGDEYTVEEGGTIEVPAPGVIANDSDPDGDGLEAILVGSPAHGALIFSGDGSFVYVHDGTETTGDRFTYKANDGLLDSNVATVTIIVDPTNDPPVATGDDYNVNEGGMLNVNWVLDNDLTPTETGWRPYWSAALPMAP